MVRPSQFKDLLLFPTRFEICILGDRMGLIALGHTGPPRKTLVPGEKWWFCTCLEDSACGQSWLRVLWGGGGTLCSCPGHGSSFPSRRQSGSPAAGTTGLRLLCSGWQSPRWAGGSHWDGEGREESASSQNSTWKGPRKPLSTSYLPTEGTLEPGPGGKVQAFPASSSTSSQLGPFPCPAP